MCVLNGNRVEYGKRNKLKNREREREKKRETRKEIRWLFHNSYFIRFRYPVAAYVRRKTNTGNTHTTAHLVHVYSSAIAALQTIHHRTNTHWTHFPRAHTHAHTSSMPAVRHHTIHFYPVAANGRFLFLAFSPRESLRLLLDTKCGVVRIKCLSRDHEPRKMTRNVWCYTFCVCFNFDYNSRRFFPLVFHEASY